MKVFLLFSAILFNFFLFLIANEKMIVLELNAKEDVCRYFPNNATIRKPGSCKETLKCENGKSTPHSLICDGDKIVAKDMKCGPNKNDKYCEVQCEKNNKYKWIEDKKNCNEWHQCNGTTLIKSSSCPNGQIFIQNEQRCIYDNNECYRKYNICDVAETNKPFWDEYNCHKYFICDSKGNLISKACAKNTDYYDIRSGDCIAKAKVDCYKHPVPLEACGNKKFALRNRFVKDQATCRGYFYCRDLGINRTDSLSYNYIPDEDPHWGQCKMGEFFDEETQSCRDQNYINCDEDRCDSRQSGKILSPIKGCQDYIVCKNGHTDDEDKCEDNKYFDPIIGECVNRKISYPICE